MTDPLHQPVQKTTRRHGASRVRYCGRSELWVLVVSRLSSLIADSTTEAWGPIRYGRVFSRNQP